MKSSKLPLLLLLPLLSASCGKDAPPTDTMGLKRIALVDDDRLNWAGDAPRPLTTYIWYPATPDSDQAEIGIPPGDPVFIGGFAARNARLRPSKQPRPLIILSHGTGGSAMQMMWLARPLVEAGYIVAAVDHHGNTAAEGKYDARGFKIVWERPVDLSHTIDKLLQDPVFGSAIDRDHMAAIGFSLGGYSVLSLAGGRIDLDRFAKFCASPDRDKACQPQDEFPDMDRDFERLQKADPRIPAMRARHNANYQDTRIKYVAALAPAIGSAFTDSSLEKIPIPVRIIVGSEDIIAPAATNGARIASQVGKAKFTLVKGAGHYAFLNKCIWKSRLFIPVCKDAHTNRKTVHEMTANIILNDLRSAGF